MNVATCSLSLRRARTGGCCCSAWSWGWSPTRSGSPRRWSRSGFSTRSAARTAWPGRSVCCSASSSSARPSRSGSGCSWVRSPSGSCWTPARRWCGATSPPRSVELTGRPTGELVTRVTSDTGLLHEASSSLVGLINARLAMVATLVLMGVLDLVLLALHDRRRAGGRRADGAADAARSPRRRRRRRSRSAGSAATLEGALRAIRTVKASRAEARQTERIVADARDAAAHGIRAARAAAVGVDDPWTGIQLAIIAILGIGAWRASSTGWWRSPA